MSHQSDFIVRRTESERVAYMDGYLAALDYAIDQAGQIHVTGSTLDSLTDHREAVVVMRDV